MWTILQLIESSAELLKQRGSGSPRVDAEWLLAHAMGQSRTWLYMNAKRPVDDEERERYRAMIGRRARGEPVAYITGTAGFWTLDLEVDARVLVPRPETERVVETALERLGGYVREDWRIVDVGTGSGAIALALASELPAATLLATDVSPGALEVARANADRLGLRERVRFAMGDLLATLGGRSEVVDVVVSNPPYVADDDPDLHADVRAHEPALALFAGPDGLSVFARLLPEAHRALVPGGLFVAEFGARQGAALAELARRWFASVEIVKDYSGHDRVLVASKAGTLAPRRSAEGSADAAPDDGELRDQAVDSDPDDTGRVRPDGPGSEPEGTQQEGSATPSDAELMLAEALAEGLPVISLDEL